MPITKKTAILQPTNLIVVLNPKWINRTKKIKKY